MNTQLSKSIKASWKNPEVAVRRSAKNHVRVRGQGEFRSVCAAFAALDLPMGQHAAFRAELKKLGRGSFRHEGKSYAFTVVNATLNK